MAIKLRRLVAEGDRIPAGYGVAFFTSGSRYAVCYPRPLHWVVNRLHNWLDLVAQPPANEWEETLQTQCAMAYNRGWEERGQSYQASLSNVRQEEFAKGYGSGYQAGYNHAHDTMVEVITEEIKKAMGAEIRAGRWWTMAPPEARLP